MVKSFITAERRVVYKEWLPFQDNIIGAKIRGLGTAKLPLYAKESELQLNQTC
jgi:hypothetical protein